MNQAVEAAKTAVAVCDRSLWGRILVSDADRLRFLHNQTTNTFEQRQPGEGCDTVFVNSTGRTLDLATAYVLEDAVLLLVSPNRRQFLMQWMDRFIFFADKVKLEDITDATATFSLIGPGSDALIEKLGAGEVVGQPYGTHQVFDLNGIEVRVAVGSGLALPGYTLMLSADQSPTLWATLTDRGAAPLSQTDWDRLRIEQGRPTPDQELTEDYNPLEAGLWNTISLSKGCYIGQETIARLHTYRGVKQQLWGVRLPAGVSPESTIMVGEERVGKLTSCTPTDDGYFGLAYIRTKAIEADVRSVQIEGVEGQLVPVPFVKHEYL
jgi:folate-binding protein YgfZ